MNLSIVVPVYKGEKLIEPLVVQFNKSLPAFAENYEIILVNDGSPDNSWAIIQSLIDKVSTNTVKEVILALNATMEGETTSFFVFKKLNPYHVLMSAIARGIAVGDELEYTDEITLARSISNRVPFNDSLKK